MTRDPKTLDQIGLEHDTDKASHKNNFLQLYSRFLEPFRDKEVRVLEIGVLGGASIRTWRDYFPRGQIIGADINPEVLKYADDRIQVVLTDQSSASELEKLMELGPFDLIIDDGSHVWSHQILTFNTLFRSVKQGGFYILEDLDTSYGSYIPDYKGDGGPSTAAYLQRLSDWVIGWRVLDPAGEEQAILDLWPEVDSITFACGTSLIRRRVWP